MRFSYTDQQMSTILSYPIADYLGVTPNKAGRFFIKSPFNPDERTPSFEINPAGNVFHCFSTGNKGGILELVRLMEGLPTRMDAARWIGDNVFHIVVDGSSGIDTSRYRTPTIGKGVHFVYRPEQPRCIRLLGISWRITSEGLNGYIRKRGVDKDIVEKYCREVHYCTASHPDQNFRSIGFQNNKTDPDGFPCFALRNETKYKLSTGQAESTVNAKGNFSQQPSSDTVVVFEGFYDFLSWLQLTGRREPGCDVCVLNSVNNFSSEEEKGSCRYIGSHDRIWLMLDRDKAGVDCTEAMCAAFGGELEIEDLSWLYDGFKDVNEALQGDSEGAIASRMKVFFK